MANRASKLDPKSAHRTLSLLHWLLRDYPYRDFAIDLWGGERWPPAKNCFQRFTWKINRPDLLQALVQASDRQLALAESYIAGDFDILGDIEAIFPLADYLIHKKWSIREKLHLMSFIGPAATSSGHALDIGPHLHGRLHSRSRDQQAVRYHYDVSNEFYELWLDPEMVYSCAYFEQPGDDISVAQKNKLDYICRKLRLAPGDRFLDIGCGWGALVIHAAREYGVQALGISISERQVHWAKRRVQSLGLSDRCEIRLLDYRDLDSTSTYDKLASIGMVEHVGESMLREYFERAFRLLRPGGAFLNAGIGRPDRARDIDDQSAFTDRYIFPDGELVSIGTLLSHAEHAGFEVSDVENLREHYRLTLHHWLGRLEQRSRDALHLIGQSKFRMWQLFLAGSAYYFQKGWLDLYHSLLLKPDDTKPRIPLTRDDWYRLPTHRPEKQTSE